MKTLRIFAAILSLLLLFSSCSVESARTSSELKELEITVYRNGKESLDENSEQLAYTTYGEVRISAADQEHYPALYDALMKFNGAVAENSREIYEELLQSAHDMLSEPEFSTPLPYYSSEELYICRADETIVSVLSYIDYYLGGAHGYHYCYGTTFDTKTGKTLAPSDVVIEPEKLPKLIKAELLKHYRERLMVDMDSLDELLSDYDSLSWSFEPDGITFYFDPYALASYADGILFARLPESIIKPEYRADGADCAVFSEGIAFRCNDLKDDIFVSYDGEYEEDLTSINIHIGDYKYSEKISAKNAFETYIRTEDGKCFLVIELVLEDNTSEMRIYSIDGGVRFIRKINNGAVELLFDGRPVLRNNIKDFTKLIEE
ncbi:MAG: DUF3298 domain-containing protein [Oscillospiraceae bacterium]|nr:DUF3298 domain-containing protein [Oscillospiraceae bacterium]